MQYIKCNLFLYADVYSRIIKLQNIMNLSQFIIDFYQKLTLTLPAKRDQLTIVVLLTAHAPTRAV